MNEKNQKIMGALAEAILPQDGDGLIENVVSVALIVGEDGKHKVGVHGVSLNTLRGAVTASALLAEAQVTVTGKIQDLIFGNDDASPGEEKDNEPG